MVGRQIELPSVSEDDGCLTYFEGSKEIPFEIKRCFFIFDVPSDKHRADHASITTDFVLIAVNGSIEVELDDGNTKSTYYLNDRNRGLFVPKNTWMITRNYSKDAVLLVLASTRYEEGEYTNDYTEYTKQRGTLR